MKRTKGEDWACIAALVVVVVLGLCAAGCKDSSGWQSWAVGAVLQNIIEPAVRDGWPMVLAGLKPLGIVDEATGEVRLGQDTIMDFLESLVPVCQGANQVAAAQKVTAAKAQVKATKALVAPVVPQAIAPGSG